MNGTGAQTVAVCLHWSARMLSNIVICFLFYFSSRRLRAPMHALCASVWRFTFCSSSHNSSGKWLGRAGRKGEGRKRKNHSLLYRYLSSIAFASKIIFTFKLENGGRCVRMSVSLFIFPRSVCPSLPCSRRTQFDCARPNAGELYSYSYIPTHYLHTVSRVQWFHVNCHGRATVAVAAAAMADDKWPKWKRERTRMCSEKAVQIPNRHRSDTLALPFSLNAGRFYVNVTDCLANETREHGDTMRYTNVAVSYATFFFFYHFSLAHFAPLAHTHTRLDTRIVVRRQPQNASCYSDELVGWLVAALPTSTCTRKYCAPLASFRSQCDFICFRLRRGIIRRHIYTQFTVL